MTDLPPLQHWLVAAARSASLPGADDLSIPSDTPIVEAWQIAGMKTGVSDTALAEIVALHLGLKRADFANTDVAAIPLLPARVARRLGALCTSCTDTDVRVATADPVSMDMEKEVQRLTSRRVHFEIASPAQIEDTLAAAYPDADESDEHRLPALLADDESPHVLVVDDDADMRLLLRTVLQSKGFRVTEAEGGEEALRLVADARNGIHLVTLDLAMDDLPGIRVLEGIRSRMLTHALPVIVATGKADPEVEMELFAAGADDFVVKPIDPPRFLLRVQAVLRRHDRSGHPLLS